MIEPMKTLRNILLWMLTMLIAGRLDAQELKLESVTMEMMTQTMSAQRKDLNGEVCALVKVIMPGDKVVFEGNVIGDYPYKTSEYWCYLSPGTKTLKIKYPNLRPLIVDFTEFFGSGLKGHRIYNIVVQVPAVQRDIHKGPLSGEFELPNIPGATLWYIHKSTDKSEVVPLTKNRSGRLGDNTQYKFSIPEACEGDSLKLDTSNKAYNQPVTEITIKDIVNQTIQVKKPEKLLRKPFNVYVVDCMTNDTLQRFDVGLFEKSDRGGLDDYIETYITYFGNERNNPANMWRRMEIDKTYVIEFDYNENQGYTGLWDWDEKVIVGPFEESDVVIKVKSDDTPTLDAWIGTKEEGKEIKMTVKNGSMPQFSRWENKSDRWNPGTFFRFQGFPVTFPTTYIFSADGYRTMEITLYENPPFGSYSGALKNKKKLFFLKPGAPSETDHYEFRDGKLRKK